MPGRALPDPRRFPFGCDARLKLCAALLGWLCVLSAARPAAPLWIAGCAVGSLLALGVPLRSVLRPLSAGLFSACVALVLRAVLTREGPTVPLPLLGFELSEPGLRAAGLLGARILGAVSIAAWLTSTTPWLELERALGWLRVPPALLEILSLARRYISVLRESMDSARSAQTLRLGYRGWRRSLQSSGVLAGLTLARALDQALLTGQAMQLRGCRAQPERARWAAESRGNRRLAALSCAVLGASLLLSRGLPW
ncbi:MAG TPA: energy-coupling factor transporter transmembrane component T [Polyangiaceae bacterium]|jgi:cobalt/nickel transport system permease protein|nr:energy-coupling factor transporter transmembrane component T [Polyangiaceae bacterium]